MSTKVFGTLLTMQSVASGVAVVSAVKDVTTYTRMEVAVRFGRAAAAALTVGVGFNVEYSTHASDDRGWAPYFAQNVLSEIVAAEAEAVSGTVSAAATTIGLASTTNLSVGELISIVNATAGNSEIRRILTLTANTQVTVDAVVNAQTGSTVYDQAQIIPLRLNLDGIARIRFLVDAVGVGQTTVVEAVYSALDTA
jgi:hypothetical protein